MMKSFRTDKNYLLRYHAGSIACFTVLNSLLLAFYPSDWKTILIYAPAIFLMSYTKIELVILASLYSYGVSFFNASFSPLYLTGMVAAVLICFPITGLLHNAAHNLIRPRWLNRPAGELLSLSQLTGFPDWKVIHLIHHEFSDIPGKDPHPPLNKTFFEFLTTVREMANTAIAGYYFEYFGKTKDTQISLIRFAHLSKADQLLRVCFWFLILGPQMFSFFFTTAIAFKMFHYAWLNYHTHPVKLGDPMKDLDHGVYKLINIIGFGFYCHGAHHKSPKVFDPRTLVRAKAINEERLRKVS